MFSQLPCPKLSMLVCGQEGGVGCTRCCAMSAVLVPSSCNQGCGRCAHQLSERAHAPSPSLNINHKPLETDKHVVWEPCKRWWRGPVRLQGGMQVLCWTIASPYFEMQESKISIPCYHTRRTSFPHPEFCYETSMVCAMMACSVLESWSVKTVGKFISSPRPVVGEIAHDQVDYIIIQGYIC
jgi:hypothetical protein